MKKNSIQIITTYVKAFVCTVVIVSSLQSCDSYGSEWPEEASIADQTPPTAGFTAKVNTANNLTVDFTNISVSATDYVWDFGDGGSSTDKDASHDFPDFGKYTVTLIATDKLGVSNTVTQEIEVNKPTEVFKPIILNAGFESGTESWENADLGGKIQVTTSPVVAGSQAAKFPSDGSRIGYQTITVEKNKIYTLSFYYTIKTSPTGSVTVAVLGGAVNSKADLASATIATATVSDQNDANTYIKESLTFNSGENASISIYISNQLAEARVDDISIASN